MVLEEAVEDSLDSVEEEYGGCHAGGTRERGDEDIQKASNKISGS